MKFPKKMNLRNNRNLVIGHFSFWLLYVLFNFVVVSFTSSIQNSLVSYPDFIAKYVIAAIIFYANLFLVLPIYFKKKKVVPFVTLLLLSCFLSFLLKEFIYRQVLPVFDYPKLNFAFNFAFSVSTWWWFQFTFFAVGYAFAFEAIDRQKTISKLEKEQYLNQHERLMAEHNYLKAQINPHFFYNALNFVYSKSLESSPEIAEAILAISEMMHYSFASSKEENEYGELFLSKEIEHIQNLLFINKLRFGKSLQVTFIKEGNFENLRIISFVLPTLVENIFKHGNVQNNFDPAIIQLKYIEDEKLFAFYSRNKKIKKINGMESNSIGIGLENVRRRLQYAYPNKHELKIDQENEHYIVNFKLKYA